MVLFLPIGHEIEGGWLRVRDEGDKITTSLKIVTGGKIENQKEFCLKIDNFNEAVELLEHIGCRKKAYQESRREIWQIGETVITIDEWPFLDPFVEIEGKSENDVKEISKKLGFDYKEAIFQSADYLYSKKYGIPTKVINDETPRIVFGEKTLF